MTIVSDPLQFREEFLSQVPLSKVDEQFGAVLRVILYYAWRGAFESRNALLQSRVQTDVGFLSLSVYLALLPVVQAIRLGYPSDAITLLRALMERIALMSYLHHNKAMIPKYAASNTSLQGKAMTWVKSRAPENWMRLYSELTKVAHSRKAGTAGHILGGNSISAAFRSTSESKPRDDLLFVDELFAMVCYAIAATDAFGKEIVGRSGFQAFPDDKGIVIHLPPADLIAFRDFLVRFIAKYQRGPK